MSEPRLPLAGGCMCGAARFELTAPLLGALYCHCTRCQRRTGTGFSVSAQTEPGSFRIVVGEPSVRKWDPGDGGWIKAFCGECGSQLFTVNPENHDLIAVRMGALDEDPGIRPSAHQLSITRPPGLLSPTTDCPAFRSGSRPTRRLPTQAVTEVRTAPDSRAEPGPRTPRGAGCSC